MGPGVGGGQEVVRDLFGRCVKISRGSVWTVRQQLIYQRTGCCLEEDVCGLPAERRYRSMLLLLRMRSRQEQRGWCRHTSRGASAPA